MNIWNKIRDFFGVRRFRATDADCSSISFKVSKREARYLADGGFIVSEVN